MPRTKKEQSASDRRALEFKVQKGDLRWVDPQGAIREPIACGTHRSVPVHESTSPDPDPSPEGYQPDCAECRAEAQSTFDGYIRDGSVEHGASPEERQASRTPAE